MIICLILMRQDGHARERIVPTIFDPGGIQDVNQFVIRFPKDAERTEKDGFDYGCESQRTEQGCKAIRLGSDNRYSLFRSK